MGQEQALGQLPQANGCGVKEPLSTIPSSRLACGAGGGGGVCPGFVPGHWGGREEDEGSSSLGEGLQQVPSLHALAPLPSTAPEG